MEVKSVVRQDTATPISQLEIINKTGHYIRVYREGKVVMSFPPSSQAARVVNTFAPCLEIIDGNVTRAVPIKRAESIKVINLPPRRNGVLYIVSSMVLTAMSGSRSDLIAPNIQEKVKNNRGVMVGVKSFYK